MRLTFTFPAPTGTRFESGAFEGSIGQPFRVRTTDGCVVGVLERADVTSNGGYANVTIAIGDAEGIAPALTPGALGKAKQ